MSMSQQGQPQAHRPKLLHKISTSQLFGKLRGGAPAYALEVCIFTPTYRRASGTCGRTPPRACYALTGGLSRQVRQ